MACCRHRHRGEVVGRHPSAPAALPVSDQLVICTVSAPHARFPPRSARPTRRRGEVWFVSSGTASTGSIGRTSVEDQVGDVVCLGLERLAVSQLVQRGRGEGRPPDLATVRVGCAVESGGCGGSGRRPSSAPCHSALPPVSLVAYGQRKSMSSMSVSVPSETSRSSPVAAPGYRLVGPPVVPVVRIPPEVRRPAPRPVDDHGPKAARDVGQQHAVHASAVVVVEREDLGDLGGPAVLVEHGDVGAREHEVLDGLPVDLLPEAERGVLDEAEQRRLHERLGRLGELVLRADDRAESPHPWDPLVALVPDQRQVAAGLEHAGDLEGPVEVEPVERRAATTTSTTGPEGDVLGRRPRSAPRKVAVQDRRASAGSGSVASTSWPSATSSAVSLPVPAPSLRTVTGLADEPGGGLAGVRRAATVVGVGDRAERTGPPQGLSLISSHVTAGLGRGPTAAMGSWLYPTIASAP